MTAPSNTDRTADRSDAGWGPFGARTTVATVLIGVSLVSIVLFASLTYPAARRLLNDTAEQQLIDLGSSRAGQIERSVGTLLASTATLADDSSITEALDELATAFGRLGEESGDRALSLTADEQSALEEAYRQGLSAITPPGFAPPTLDSILPDDDRARYLQYHYLVRNPFAPEERASLDDPGDESSYSTAHARHHPTLRAMARALRFTDLLLIDAGSETVVYSVAKRADFGTSLRNGPLGESKLAAAVLDEVRTMPAGAATVVDFDPYFPAAYVPTAFMVAPIRVEGRLAGAVAVPLSSAVLSAFTTFDGEWEAAGLGETGELYIVGSDGLMRSDSRLAREAPDDYRSELTGAGYDPEIGEAAGAFETTVLIQPVSTEAVSESLVRGSFSGTTENYLGHETVAVARQLDVPAVDWVAVAEARTSEIHGPLRDYLVRVVAAALILVLVVAALGLWLAERLIRPVEPAVAAAEAVRGGDLDVSLPDASSDEFGELGRRFNELVADLRLRDDELTRADEEITELLVAALPRRLVAQAKRGDLDIAESVRNGTVVAVAIEGWLDAQESDQEARRDLGVELLGRITALADERGLDPIHSSSSQLVFAAGLESGELEAERAAEFVVEARRVFTDFVDSHGIEASFRAGLSAGGFVAAIVGTERLAFDAWGHPPRLAIALAALAEPGQMLAGATVVEALGPEWPSEAAGEVVDFSGDPIDCWVLGQPSRRGGHETAAQVD